MGTTTRPSTGRRGFGLLVLALCAGVVTVAPPVAAGPTAQAASSFRGGASETPAVILNDHTPYLIHFASEASSGLLPSTTYYVKVRITVGTAPSGATNRGFTWNPSTHAWLQERESWTNYPQITTDVLGAIPPSTAFVKFGEESKTGTYHVLVSLSQTGLSSTYNASVAPTITVVDPRTSGSWVHNGVATGAGAAASVRVTDASAATIHAAQMTEAQSVDDNANGVVDDEDYGPPGSAGDFRVGVPATSSISVYLGGAVWAPAADYSAGPADVDLAIGAGDSVAPGEPGSLTGSSGDGTATIEWAPAFDAAGVTGYHVFRWSPVPDGKSYSLPHVRVATLGPSETSFTDSGLVDGETYLYEVRAFDAATNVGPRSNPVALTPHVPNPRAVASPLSPDGAEDWYVTTPTVTIIPGVPGRSSVYSLDATMSSWTTFAAPIAIPQGVHTLYYRDSESTSTIDYLPVKVDCGPPTSKVSVPLVSATLSGVRQFPVHWSGIDPVSGIAGYDVDYRLGKTGTWRPLRTLTSARSTSMPGTQGYTYYFRSRAQDVAGNVGTWTAEALTMVPFDQGRARRAGTWRSARRASYYLGSAAYSIAKNSSLSFTANRGIIYLVLTKGPRLGKLSVYANGRRLSTIDSYSSKTRYRQVVKVGTYSGTRAGTVKIVNLATARRGRIEIDGFAVRQ